MYKKKILIAGGTGFLGYHIAKKALKKKWSVHSISTSKPIKKRSIKGIKYHLCDVTNKKKLTKIIQNKYDYVINLSGYVDHTNKKKTYKSHYIGCKNLVNSIIKKNFLPKVFIQIGSCIENAKVKSPQIEFDPLKSIKVNSTYGQAKLNASKFLVNKFKKFNFPSVILRLYLVYGPKQDVNRFIPFVIENSIKNREFLLSKCTQSRDFLYIDDFVSLIFKILNNQNGFGKIFNVGYGKPTQLKKIVSIIKKKIKKGFPKFGKIKLRSDEVKVLYPDIKRIKKYYKWKPKIDLKSGLNKTIKHFVSEIK